MEVEVRGARGVDPFTTGASYTSLPLDGRWSAGADLGAVLDTAAGLNVLRLGGLGDFSAVSIRGSSLRQVQVYLDGVPLNPDGSAVVNLSELPLAAFQRVEVWRGNAPPELGAAPMGGVVNLVTRAEPRLGLVAASAGSYHTGRGSGALAWSGQPGGRPLELLVLADAFGTRGDYPWFSDNGTLYNTTDDAVRLRENNARQQLSAHTRLRWGGPRLRVTALNSALLRQEGLPGHANSPARQAGLGTRRNLAALELSGSAGEGRWAARGWHQHRVEEHEDRLGELGVGRAWSLDRTDQLGVLLTGSWTPHPQLQPGLTVVARQDRYLTEDLLQGRVEDPRLRRGGTATAALRLSTPGGHARLDPVLQATLLDSRLLGEVPFGQGPVAPDTEDLLLRLDPRVSLALQPRPALALRANAGRYLRPPDFTELFGDRGTLVGNTDLRPERGWAVDLGARWRSPGAWPVQADLDLALSHSEAQDLIVYLQNSQLTLRPENVGAARVQSLELSAGLGAALGAWGRVDTRSSLALTRSVNLSPDAAEHGRQLPRVPAVSASQVSTLDLPRGLSVGHTWSFTDGNYWDRTNRYRAAPRSLHSAHLRAQPWARGPALELACLNLADRITEVVPRDPLQPEDPTTVVQPITDFNGYPLPGRTWMLTLRWEARPEAP